MDLAQWLEVEMWGDVKKCEVTVNGEWSLAIQRVLSGHGFTSHDINSF